MYFQHHFILIFVSFLGFILSFSALHVLVSYQLGVYAANCFFFLWERGYVLSLLCFPNSKKKKCMHRHTEMCQKKFLYNFNLFCWLCLSFLFYLFVFAMWLACLIVILCFIVFTLPFIFSFFYFRCLGWDIRLFHLLFGFRSMKL